MWSAQNIQSMNTYIMHIDRILNQCTTIIRNVNMWSSLALSLNWRYQLQKILCSFGFVELFIQYFWCWSCKISFFCCLFHAGLLGCLYESCFKSVLLENVTDNPGHISWYVSSPDKHHSESGQTSNNNCCVEQINKHPRPRMLWQYWSWTWTFASWSCLAKPFTRKWSTERDNESKLLSMLAHKVRELHTL
jgi:hypothetical protein